VFYLIGGAPRVGKTILCQRISAELQIGWVSTDLLYDLLRFKDVPGVKTEWDAAPEAITAAAEWSFASLERFIWGVNSMADSYAIEGVDFLPAQVAQLSTRYPLRGVFLGCSHMTLEQFDQFPGRSRGYAHLPEAMRRQIVRDVPLWSEFIRQEAGRCGYPYIDMAGDFTARLSEAAALLTANPPGPGGSINDTGG
jgi:hypothetical protein